ncbi:YggS family pyridoxal phosphate-dependent enzyme [Breoghania sp.]|uniref:YggS family pyridoxal phosphate-dependent enzyme n=1 Tax=Breoghania sp. TaxID=2065378 RepID=UPI002620F382|nr:YggS family pyridoxal phosphate-dependent enzyme [Breoghania sp.]MDJ0930520.1 YggS family pyridoxal phosphate-dependent enzyme [Breoghania sp.]
MAETAAGRLAQIRDRIAVAERESNRAPGEVTLIAVSKTFDATDIQPIIDAGQRIFGENRVQEAQGKWPALKEAYPDIELHLIGPLQSNKTHDAVTLFDAIHTVDRDKIARAIAREMKAQGRTLKLFIQVNTGDEPQKAGVSPKDAGAFIKRCREEFGLTICGLMCIPPVDEEPAPHFALLEKIAQRNGIKGLSMGMSGDFETSVGHGASHVRVGSAIFGHRD